MFDRQQLEELRQALERWEETTRQQAAARMGDRRARFVTTSSSPVNELYTPLDIADLDYDRDLGLPGEYPYTRGVHPTMYRGRLWTMRMFAGFGTAEETNKRFRYLLDQGQTGLSIAFDLPTLMGYDSDAPEALGEFGKCGVAISSLRDMEGCRPSRRPVSSSIRSTPRRDSPPIAAADRGVARQLRRLQNTSPRIHREGVHLSLRAVDAPGGRHDRTRHQHLPQWNTISISGYHIREAGSTAAQELAFTLLDGLEYVRWGLARGLPLDAFAPRLSFFFNAHNDFFEEIAKYRAARRIWAHEMRHTFGAADPRSWLMRFHTQTAGVSLAAQQPENNIVRVTVQALAAVLGGTQSLHTNSMDEALALPSQEAVTIALRTQQILAEDSGVANTIDPLGGSFFVEATTDRMEREARSYFQQVQARGGVLPAIADGFFQREIAEAAYRYQREIDAGERSIVGVNAFQDDKPVAIPILAMDPAGWQRQSSRLETLRRERDAGAVGQALDRLRLACQGSQNTMPFLLDAVRAYATLGEIVDVLRGEFGTYIEPSVV
jgi:methylmalonyl-CoA mutase N-terminal domain/subunit